MPSRKPGKRYNSDVERATKDPVPLTEAVNRVKSFKKTKFDQTVELCMYLGIDPKQADQMLRGAISLQPAENPILPERRRDKEHLQWEDAMITLARSCVTFA